MAARKKPTSRKSNPRKAKKLGFDIDVKLPMTGRHADVSILKAGTVVTTERGDLGDGRDRRRIANRLATDLGGKPEQWERALQKAHLDALQLRDAARQAAQSQPRPVAGSPADVYTIEAGRHCLKRLMPGGEVTIALCNFEARVTENICTDDGAEVQHYFTVVGTLDNGKPLPAVRIRASEFGRMDWPISVWGLDAMPAAGLGTKDHLRCAIQSNSGGATDRKVFKHLGWRFEGGEWMYLHAGGAITARGHTTERPVELDGPLALFGLPHPPTGNELAEALRHGL